MYSYEVPEGSIHIVVFRAPLHCPGNGLAACLRLPIPRKRPGSFSRLNTGPCINIIPAGDHGIPAPIGEPVIAGDDRFQVIAPF